MSKYNIDDIFKKSEQKHRLYPFEKKLISSITLYDKKWEIICQMLRLA